MTLSPLGGYEGEFNKYYCGTFDKSFSSLSNLLAAVKFIVDLSVLKHDGGYIFFSTCQMFYSKTD